jgi:hypothetical protein
MLPRTLGSLAVLCSAALAAPAADYSAKVADGTPPPKELAEAVRGLLAERCVQFVDGKGEVLAELWFRKEVPAKATDAQVKNGLTYREVPEATLLGAVRFPKPAADYRKQKVPAGVYTLRLGFQPMDGDHMGTAPYGEFCLASPAADDRSPEPMETKALHELSAKATNSHPAVFLLFPAKDAAEPKAVDKGDGHWVLEFKQGVDAAGKKAGLGVGLVLVGASSAA